MKNAVMFVALIAALSAGSIAHAAWGNTGQVVSITQSNNAAVNATRTVIELSVS